MIVYICYLWLGSDMFNSLKDAKEGKVFLDVLIKIKYTF